MLFGVLQGRQTINRLIEIFHSKDFESSLERKRVSLMIIFCARMKGTLFLSGIILAFINPTIEIYTVLIFYFSFYRFKS